MKQNPNRSLLRSVANTEAKRLALMERGVRWFPGRSDRQALEKSAALGFGRLA